MSEAHLDHPTPPVAPVREKIIGRIPSVYNDSGLLKFIILSLIGTPLTVFATEK